MDGWDFLANQLIDPDLSAIPVVVITAAGFRAETIQRQLAGVGFIRKPLLLDEVLTAAGPLSARVRSSTAGPFELRPSADNGARRSIPRTSSRRAFWSRAAMSSHLKGHGQTP